MSKIICVIGGGAAGLTATKQCIEDKLDVICYERTDNLGGLWRYREEVIDGVPSIPKSTIMNTSKEMSAFSDFPPPKHFPNYMPNSVMCQYLEMYAQYFDLRKYMRFNHQVISVTYNDDYEDTGKWKVIVLDTEHQKTNERIFDGVLVCTGHHIKPLIAQFPGQEKFKGKIIHSHLYKTWKGFEDKTVVVVGLAASGGDIAAELATVAKQVYVATRNGVWIQRRVWRHGIPFDISLITRAANFTLGLLPFNVANSLMEWLINSYFDHRLYGLNPKHRVLSQHAMINDCIANYILGGAIRVRRNIKEFTENGVIFEGFTDETKCDVVVLATGFAIDFPFLDPSLVSVVNNKIELYKNMFVPHLKHPETLGFVGLMNPSGPLFCICEMQSRWFARLMNGAVKLPSKQAMLKSIADEVNAREKRFYNSPRHTLEVNWIQYLDEIASYIGVKPNLWKYAVTDRSLWYALVFGPSLSYQYRLEGHNKWSAARETILSFHERMMAPLKQLF